MSKMGGDDHPEPPRETQHDQRWATQRPGSGLHEVRIGMVNYVYPADQLDAATLAFCKRVALLPLDQLTGAKHAINHWFEIAGLCTAMWEDAKFDAICHESPSSHEFFRISRKHGEIGAGLARYAVRQRQRRQTPRAAARSGGD